MKLAPVSIESPARSIERTDMRDGEAWSETIPIAETDELEIQGIGTLCQEDDVR